MNTSNPTISEQLALAASRLQQEQTGRAPKAVSVVLSDDTLVVTLHEALSPAEKVLAKGSEGALQVEDLHRQLFNLSSEKLRQEIQRITGRKVREAAVEIEPLTGDVVHAFTTGTVVQIFLLSPLEEKGKSNSSGSGSSVGP
jgi:uncharacterized protein YbcI